MNYLMTTLRVDELNLVCGTAYSGIISKSLFVTAKKLSMLWCVGKELKLGVQNLNVQSFVNAGSCIFFTTIAREVPYAFATKKSGEKIKIL